VPHRSDENPTAPEPAHTPRRAARRTPHGLSVVAQTQLADQVIRGCTDTLHVRPARPQLGQDRLRQPRHQVHSNDTHMPMMHHSNIDQLTNRGGAGASGLAPSDPVTAQDQRVQIVSTFSSCDGAHEAGARQSRESIGLTWGVAVADTR